MNISEVWDLYYQDKILEGFSPNTLTGYKIQLNLLSRYFGEKDINEITIFNLKQYLIERGSHLKPSSLGARIRFIRAFFRYLADEGYIDKNPASKLKEPKLGQRIPKSFNEEELELLREGCKTKLEHSLIEILFSSGMRANELHMLNIKDINWENRSCIVLGKGNKQREIYFSQKAKIWLKWYIESRNDDDPALFVTQRKPHRLSIDMMRYIVKRIGRQANLDINVYNHRFRHSFAQFLVDKNCPLEAVQDQLGHVKLETTKIYCQLSGQRRKQIHDTYF